MSNNCTGPVLCAREVDVTAAPHELRSMALLDGAGELPGAALRLPGWHIILRRKLGVLTVPSAGPGTTTETCSTIRRLRRKASVLMGQRVRSILFGGNEEGNHHFHVAHFLEGCALAEEPSF